MVYVVNTHTHRRLEMISDTGKEQYEQAGTEDLSYLQALDKQAQDNAAGTAEPPPNPQAAVEMFQAALGECDVIVDLINNLQQLRHLDYKLISGKPRSAHAAMQQVTSGRMLRAGLRRQSLRDAASRLREGAAGLRLVAQQDNDFHAQVSQLQHYWCIRRAPVGSIHGPDAPYLVDLSLGNLVAINNSTTATGGAGAGAGRGRTGAGGGGAGRGGEAAGAAGTPTGSLARMLEVLTAVPLLRGPGGQLRLQLPPQLQPHIQNTNESKPSTPSQKVYIGLKSVHGALLGCQQRLIWALLLDLLDSECVQSIQAGGHNFMFRLTRLLMDLLARHPSLADPVLTSLRPVLLEHCLATRLAPPLLSSQQPKGQQSTTPSTPPRLLNLVVGLMSHMCTRSGLRRSITQQVVSYPEISLHWVPSGRLGTSALLVKIGAMDSCLLTVQDTTIEIDGVVCGSHTGTRWGYEGHTSVTRHELPHLLPLIILNHAPNQITTNTSVLT